MVYLPPPSEHELFAWLGLWLRIGGDLPKLAVYAGGLLRLEQVGGLALDITDLHAVEQRVVSFQGVLRDVAEGEIANDPALDPARDPKIRVYHDPHAFRAYPDSMGILFQLDREIPRAYGVIGQNGEPPINLGSLYIEINTKLRVAARGRYFEHRYKDKLFAAIARAVFIREENARAKRPLSAQHKATKRLIRTGIGYYGDAHSTSSSSTTISVRWPDHAGR